MPIKPRLADPNAAAHERLYRTLRQQVMHGELAPGQAVTLRGLAEQFGMSMTPARDAVRRLVAGGGFAMAPAGRSAAPERPPARLVGRAAIGGMQEPEGAA